MQLSIRSATPPRTPKSAARRRSALDACLDPQLFAALADPTRLKLVACIAKCRRPCSVGEVAQCCEVDLSVVSRHLKALAAAGVLEQEREGRVVRYHMPAKVLAARFRALAAAIEEEQATADDCCGGACDAASHGANHSASHGTNNARR